MPKIDKINDNMYTRINTGADFNRALGVLKDTVVVVDDEMLSSRVIPTGFKYLLGVNELEVYHSRGNTPAEFLRKTEIINVTVYGQYIENTNFSIKINSDFDLQVGDIIRFRVTAANYKIVNLDYSQSSDPRIEDILAQLINLRNMILQVGHDSFGQEYAFPATPSGSVRTIGMIPDGDSSPNLIPYRVWQTQNSAATSITDFDGVCEDQRLIIINDNNTTFVHSSNLILSNALNISAQVGEIYQFLYDGSNWRQYGSGGSTTAGIQKWKQTYNFTGTPASIRTLTMTEDMTTEIIAGMAVKYKIGATYYYGMVTAITNSLLTIAGPSLTSTVTELYYDETLTKVTQIVIPIEGYYETVTDATLISNYLGYSLPWSKHRSYLVRFTAVSKTVDTGATKGKVQVTLNGASVHTDAGGLTLSVNNQMYYSLEKINPVNYGIDLGRNIELSVTKGSNGDALDLTVTLQFVCP
jgi:hypothetical protein